MDWFLGLIGFLGRLAHNQQVIADVELGQAFEAFWPILEPTLQTPQAKRFFTAAQACATALTNSSTAAVANPATPYFHSDDPRYENLNHME